MNCAKTFIGIYIIVRIVSDAFLTVSSDGLFQENVTNQNWREPSEIYISPWLLPRILSVRAKLYNQSGFPAILASVENTGKEIYTDQYWECRRIPRGSWFQAKSYGINNGGQYPAIASINANAHWIWTNNTSDPEVDCRKNLSGWKMVKRPPYI